ncbi:ER-associated protein degradation protein [Turnera subulata]|uniref:Derlin n=1 Tax=Turnera subulata TaxID=218843 RepID=A0A9Q0FJP5_9ROSI|nr:ER-associated protein degradation protein [Turnera subulata]
MSSPAEYYNSLPPISKAYGTLCLAFTAAVQLGLLDLGYIALIYPLAFSRFQVWRLITNFFFLGKFSINFGIRLLMIARYGVQLENGPFERRTADFLWMMIFGAFTMLVLGAIPIFHTYFMGISLVFMLLYVWSREYPNAQINIYGLVTLKAFYFPWAMLALDVIFGSPIMPDLLGIIAGHLYYFLTVLHPLATGKTLLKTPRWLHNVVARWRIGAPARAPAPTSNRGQAGQTAGVADRSTGVAFRGRSYRLSD